MASRGQQKAPPTPSSYHRMSVGQKTAAHREKMREPAVVCPACQAQTTAADLVRHMESTCPGQRPIHPLSQWESWREVRARGVAKVMLHKWVRRGEVRAEGPMRRRKYLVADVVLAIGRRMAQVKRNRVPEREPSSKG